MFKIYNTLSQQKETLSQERDKPIGLYVCGMTVYDECHLGHARVWVIFDVLIRYLTQLGYSVNYVRNITDVDDKIIQRALENKEHTTSLTQRMIASMHDDMKALALLPPTHEPRATEHIAHIVALIARLIQKGYAYSTESGDVYYSVKEFKNYGQLAQQNLGELMSGARVEVDTHKKHPLDFALWKSITDSNTIHWQSPWGAGRPGWHIECSAMALEKLGASFDIHGGGADLKFPHHQNEIAQSEAITQQPFVKYWMHVGFVQINQDKMSKSAGNALTLKALRKEFSGEIIRYFLLTSHYRSPLLYQKERLHAAEKGLRRLYKAKKYAKVQTTLSSSTLVTQYEDKFNQALADDLNTPVALSVLFDIARHVNRLGESEESVHLASLLSRLGGLLGLLQQDQLPSLVKENLPDNAWIENCIQKRDQARQLKEWVLADKIRETLLKNGIELVDTNEGTHWFYRGADSAP